MGKSKVRPFVRKNGNTQIFYLVNEYEPVIKDGDDAETQEQRVYEDGTQGEYYSKKEWELAAMELPDDGYDYFQHLRKIGNNPGSVFIPAGGLSALAEHDPLGSARRGVGSSGEKAMDTALKKDAILIKDEVDVDHDGDDGKTEPEEAKLSEYEMEKRRKEEEYEKELAKLRKENEDLNEVLQMLDESEQEEDRSFAAHRDEAELVQLDGTESWLPDDFIVKANGAENGSILKKHGKKVKSRADDDACEYQYEEEEEGEEEGEEAAARRAAAFEAGRKARLLDEQFDQFMEGYDEEEHEGMDDLGEGEEFDDDDNENDDDNLDHGQDSDEEYEDVLEKLGGEVEIAHLMDDVHRLRIGKDQDRFESHLDNDDKKELRARFQYESESDHGWESDPFLHELEKKANATQGEQWDCETIVTTYTNTENHPSMIGLPRKPRKPKTSASTSSFVATSRDADDSGAAGNEKVGEAGSSQPVNTSRYRGESKEERKQRKAEVKSHRRERRAEKSETKNAFRSENARQANQAARMGTSKVVVQFT